jgi:hypothetical protein
MSKHIAISSSEAADAERKLYVDWIEECALA